MEIYKEDIVDIELETGTIHRSFMNKTIGLSDNKGDRFGVRLFRNGVAENVSAATVTGLFMAPDGNNYIISGSGNYWVSENVAGVILPGACYAVEGQFCLAIKLSLSGVVSTVRIIDGVVSNTGTTGAVVPSSSVPTSDQIIAAYNNAVEMSNNSVRFDISQSIDQAGQIRARNNIQAASIEDIFNVKNALDGDNRLLNNCIDIQNMLPRTFKLSLVQGVNATYDDGVITLSGTAQYDGGRLVKITPVFTLEAGTYVATRSEGTVVTHIEKEIDDSIILTFEDGDNVFTLSERTNVYIGVTVDSGNVYSNVVNNVQIMKGGVSKPFKKTTIGIPNDTIAREQSELDKKYIDGNKLMIESMSDAINLLPVISTITNVNNVVVSYNYGNFSAIGTANASGGRNQPIAPLITLKQGTYLFKRDFSGIVMLLTNVNDSSDYILLVDMIVSFTVQTEKTYIIGVNVDPGVSYNVSGHIQITEGTESIDFVNTYNRKAFDLQARHEINTMNRIVNDSTYPSRNILPIYVGERVVNGVTVEYNDGVMKTNGIATVTGGRTTYIAPNVTLQPGKYVLSRNFDYVVVYLTNVNDSSDYVSLLYESGHNVNERAFTVETEKTYGLGLNFVSGVNYSDLSGMIQLEIGESASEIVKTTFITPKDVEQLKTEIKDVAENVNDKITKPSTDGILGQALVTNGDGTTEWTDAARPTDQQIENTINSYLSEHPEVFSTTGFVTPEIYGAWGDGSHDDSDAFHQAINSGKPVFLSKTYLLATQKATHWALKFLDDLPDGLILFGNGTIKFPSNANSDSDDGLGINMFYINGVYHISGITIDMNGLNNLVTGNVRRTMYAFYGNLNNSVIENVTIKNSAGRNMLMLLDGDNNKIINCDFIIGGTNLPGNGNQDDFTFIYCQTTRTLIDGCTLDGVYDFNNDYGCTGIEIHRSDTKVTNCTIQNVKHGIHIVNNDTYDPISNIIVSNNDIQALFGVSFWYTSPTSGITYINTFKNITIANNIITIRKTENSTKTGAICFVNISDSNPVYPEIRMVTISNNTINAINILINGKYIIDLKNVLSAVLNGNVIKTIDKGIFIDGNYCVATGNIIECASNGIDINATSKSEGNNIVIT